MDRLFDDDARALADGFRSDAFGRATAFLFPVTPLSVIRRALIGKSALDPWY